PYRWTLLPYTTLFRSRCLLAIGRSRRGAVAGRRATAGVAATCTPLRRLGCDQGRSHPAAMRHGRCGKLGIPSARACAVDRPASSKKEDAMSDLYPVKPEFAARARIGKDDYQRL